MGVDYGKILVIRIIMIIIYVRLIWENGNKGLFQDLEYLLIKKVKDIKANS